MILPHGEREINRSPHVSGKKTIDVDAVKAVARGRWCDILPGLTGLDREFFNGNHGPCPRCHGVDRYRMIDRDAGACLCSHCHSEKCGDGISTLRWLQGWEFRETIERVCAFLGISVPYVGGGGDGSDGSGAGGAIGQGGGVPAASTAIATAAVISAAATTADKRTPSNQSSQLTFPAEQHGLRTFKGMYCLQKPPITFKAIDLAGGKVAEFRSNRRFKNG